MSFIYQPNSMATIRSYSSKTLSANNTTATVPIFRMTGTIEIMRLYGIVTTTIGANHTGAYFRLNDQTSQINITLNTGGMTLSALPAGTAVLKNALATSIALAKSAAAGFLVEPTDAEVMVDSGLVFGKKSGANTDIEYIYSTTDTPTSGAIQFFLDWVPLSADAAVTPQ